MKVLEARFKYFSVFKLSENIVVNLLFDRSKNLRFVVDLKQFFSIKFILLFDRIIVSSWADPLNPSMGICEIIIN